MGGPELRPFSLSSVSHHSFAGYLVASSVPLVELPEIGNPLSQGVPDFLFSVQSVSSLPRGPFEWIHHWHGDRGDPTISMAREGEGFLLRFPSFADFSIQDDGAKIPREFWKSGSVFAGSGSLMGHPGRAIQEAEERRQGASR